MTSVTLDPPTVLFPHTYISSVSRYTMTIYSSNQQNVHYEWRRYGSREEEEAALANFDINDPEQREKYMKMLEFSSNFFAITPKSAELWPKRKCEVVVSYCPDLAMSTTETAYLYIKETDERIPLTLIGAGLAPDARFNIDTINVGHVNLDTIWEYQVILENIGQVVVDFELVNHEVPGLIFEFWPEQGQIPIGESVKINCRFTANSVCSFNETFQFHVHGAVELQPKLTLYGKVLNPTFSISEKTLNFETVSYGFVYTHTFEIENKSDIAFDYELRLDQDGTFNHREFRVSPAMGTLMEFEKQEVSVEFIPISLQDYRVNLFMDIDRFGKDLAKVKIIGTCVCPTIVLETPLIDMGYIFIGNPYQIEVKLQNNSNLPAKYEYIPNTDETVLMARVSTTKPTGIVAPAAVTKLVLQVTPNQLGPIALTQSVKILGADYPPLQYEIKAICTGPKILLDKDSIDFGTIGVLSDITRHLTVKNDSLICAFYKLKVECDTDSYRTVPEEGHLEPGEERTIDVIANVDDTVAFPGKLILVVQNNSQIVVSLSATGAGSTIRSSVPLNSIDFGYIFSQKPVEWPFQLTNYGRRAQEVRWSAQKPKLDSPNALFNFSIQPDHVYIQPHQTVDFNFVAHCSKPASFSVIAQCNSTVARKRADLYTPMIKGVFVEPLLDFSTKQLTFEHIHDPAKEEAISKESGSVSPAQELLEPITKDVTVANKSPMDLNVKIDCPEPFVVGESEFVLESGHSYDIHVTFDPKFKTDFITETLHKQMVLTCEGHHTNVTISLTGTVMFPNVSFTPGVDVDFGVLLANTEETKDVVLKNTSEIPVDLFWELLPVDGQDGITKIFDVYPIREHIEPGAESTIRFSFFAQNGEIPESCSYSTVAVCHIVGGPEYTLNLKGSSAAIEYKIDPLFIDFGSRHYLEELKQRISLQNLSDVPITYTILIPKSLKFNVINFNPMTGTIPVGESTTIDMKVIPGLPVKYQESVTIQIGHFNDIRLDIAADCYIPQIQMDANRAETDPLMQAYSAENQFSIESRNPTPDDLSKLECKLLVEKLTGKQSAQTLPEILSAKRRKKKDPSVYDGPISSVFDVDMGDIVFGIIETKEVSFKSISPFPIDIDIKQACLNGTGFSITPAQFCGVPPGEELQLTFTFDVTKRTDETVGDVAYDIPLVFGESLAYSVHLHANLAVPTLKFSHMHFNFGSVVVGHTKIITLQLQNMNYVPCEFEFEEAQFTNVIQRQSAQDSVAVYHANPSCGVLPPSSFLNIEIAFEPQGDRNYPMQFPIQIRHNPQPCYVTMRGTGVQLKIVFDPPQLIMPPINPFSDPSEAEITLCNPTAYPIEVMAQQFDLKLYVEDVTKEMRNGLPLPTDLGMEETITISSPNNTVSKFAICVIVNGPDKSGRTTVSRAVSNYLGGVPILLLQEVWADLLAKEEPPEEIDFIDAIRDVISEPEYAEGFVVDGLDVLQESPETAPFIQHCMKQKRVEQELEKNPFMEFPHNTLTAKEQAMAYVLGALNGHYVFHIALKTTEDATLERSHNIEMAKWTAERDAYRKKNQVMFNMTEEQYMALTEEEREEVDKERTAVREQLLKKAMEGIEQKPVHDDKRHTRARSQTTKARARPRTVTPKDTRGKRQVKSSRREEPKQKHELIEPSLPPPPPPPQLGKKNTRQQKELSAAIKFGIMKFAFTLGTLAARIGEETETYKVVDPIDLLHISPDPSPRGSDDGDNHPEEEDQFVTHTNFIKESTADESKPSISFHHKNTLLVIGTAPQEDIAEEVRRFLPTKRQLEEKAFTKLIPSPRLVTTDLVKEKNIKLLPMPEYFKIVVPEDGKEHVERISVIRPDSNMKKAGRKSRVGNKREKNQEIEVNTDGRTPRWTIAPNSQMKITVSFDAQLVGEYKDFLYFVVMNGKTDRFKLAVSGLCDYPDIVRDFKSIFEKVLRRPDPRQGNVFVTELNEFQFGPVLITKEKPKGQPVYKQLMHLTNPSQFPARVTLSLAEKGPWMLQQNNIVIPPNESTDLFFGLNPATADVYKARLAISVADNPEPISYNLSAEGCSPVVEISTTQLDFDKILLKQSRKLRIEVKNTGRLPAFWHFKNVQQLGDTFRFTATEGVLKPAQATNVDVIYSSAKPLMIKKAINFEVMDVDKTKVWNSIPVQVTAETFLVNFDFVYPKGIDHLQFGSLKVSQTKTITCSFKNKGKYPELFKFVSKTPYLTIAPEQGTAQPGKDVHINFKFTAPKPVKIENEKMAVLTVSDKVTNTDTGTLTLSMSAMTVFSQFVLEPPAKVLQFGAVTVSTTESQQFSIKNTGLFPFEYTIYGSDGPAKEPEKASPRKGKTSPRKSPQKSRGKKGMDKPMTIGSFVFSPYTATIQPGTTVPIDVEYFAANPGKISELVHIAISDANPKAQTGVPLKLKANSYVPGIETRDFARIFKGNEMGTRYGLVKLDQNCFLEDDYVLHFAPLILQKRQTLPVTLINPLPIPCTVDIVINSVNKQTKPQFPFDTSEKVVELEPNGSKTIDVSFVPVTCDKFSGEFEATVRGGTDEETRLLRFPIEGTGTLPIISVVSNVENKGKTSYSINLGRTLVGFTREKMVTVRNDGVINARLNVSCKTVPDFQLTGFPQPVTEVCLEPGRLLNLPVVFAPQKPRSSKLDINITVFENPKSGVNFSFLGEGYYEDVILEGLQEDDIDISFKDSVVGRPQEWTFRMRNLSQSAIRFTWPVHSDLTFSPRIGHLRVGQTKNITVTLFTEKPIKMNGAKFNCQWCKIEYSEKDAPDWDDTMKVVKYVPKSSLEQVDESKTTRSQSRGGARRTSPAQSKRSEKPAPEVQAGPGDTVKVIEVKPEPTFTQQPGKFKDLQLKISAVSDYIRYTLDTDTINFSPTMMYQSRVFQVKMTNPSAIRFNYNWRVAKFESARTSYAKTRHPPFSVEPCSGGIDPGQATVFRVRFAPEEVDEFTAQLKCEIPFLHSSQPPVINVTALSRRPLCHFSVDTSDYISAGKRHPDYKYDLPSDVKVIEIFSGGIGQKATKRFEVVNPTSSPYEVQWIQKVPSADNSIACDTPCALVSSGRRYTMSFSYTPTTVKPVECLWEFKIPEHQTSMSFLTVGRIVPK